MNAECIKKSCLCRNHCAIRINGKAQTQLILAHRFAMEVKNETRIVISRSFTFVSLTFITVPESCGNVINLLLSVPNVVGQ